MECLQYPGYSYSWAFTLTQAVHLHPSRQGTHAARLSGTHPDHGVSWQEKDLDFALSSVQWG